VKTYPPLQYKAHRHNIKAFLKSKRAAIEYLLTRPPSDEPGGPDPEILPWLLLINVIPGIYTVQSCAGHIKGEPKADKQGGPEGGHLWVRLFGDDPQVPPAWKLPGIPVRRIDPTDPPPNEAFPILEFRFGGRTLGTFDRDMPTIMSYLTYLTGDILEREAIMADLRQRRLEKKRCRCGHLSPKHAVQDPGKCCVGKCDCKTFTLVEEPELGSAKIRTLLREQFDGVIRELAEQFVGLDVTWEQIDLSTHSDPDNSDIMFQVIFSLPPAKEGDPKLQHGQVHT